ncbi:HutD family protein [Streptomyces ficellus]|uniref:HutD family protein n=1 Tax=Streptomyces ficellus TaxID=1977088 RepID=A0ABT7ZB98_9ACTN|nr:HutD family protein [Streptomyces ficellus]MDN3296767.1 HutD family protein [Streptomyces ficellus]
MTVRVLRAADRTAVPWKNGGGVTREIAAARPENGTGVGAGDQARDGAGEWAEAGTGVGVGNVAGDRAGHLGDGFDWRVSLADVGADGAFSSFPGTDRILTVADGTGMHLTAGGSRLLAERYVPRAFPGDVPTHGRLLAGPVVNLNVMHRRGAVTATVAVVRGTLPVGVPSGATVLIVALDGPARVADVELGRYDAVLCTGSAEELLCTDGHAAVVTLSRTG